MTDNGLPPIHPGEFLREILEELGITQAGFARALGLPIPRISQVLKGIRPVNAELALLFARAFEQSPRYWLNLQAAYDLKMAEAALAGRLHNMPTLSKRGQAARRQAE